MIEKNVLDKLEFDKVLGYIANYSITELGKEEILNTIPFENKQTIISEGNLVSEAKEVLIHNDIPPLEFLPDLYNVISRTKIEGSICTQKDILEILRLAKISRALFTFFKNNEFAPSIKILTNQLYVDKVFEHYFDKVFTDSGDIRDNATPKLAEIRREINEKSDNLRTVVNRLLKKYSESYLVQEEYITLREGRIVIPVKAEHKRHIKGFIHSESGTGQTVYIEPEETLELNNEILSLKFAEKREVDKILRNLTIKISEVGSELQQSLQIITKVDLIFSKAKFSIEVIGSFPTFNEDEPINILNARHPILLKKIGRKDAVPLNIKVDKQNVILITGPNAGGKTVVLKTFGLIVLMAQSGIHIPVDADTNLKYFDSIWMDVGDEQSIENDLSTFSSHLSNINNILNSATKDSLILIDEIGTGTDPIEGAALATATLLKLRDKLSLVLATTHHGSLKLIANDLEGFQNASMEFDQSHLIPTYRFRQGLPGSSYAFEIAERIGLDESFLDLAKEYLDSDKNQIEKFLVDIENKSHEIKNKLDNAERENVRLRGLANLYKDKIDKLEEQKKQIISKAQQEADDYLQNVNKKIEQAIKNIRESNAQKEVIKEEKKEIEKLKKVNKEKKVKRQQKEFKGNIEIGSYAQIKNTQTFGEIIDIDKKKNKAFLEVGSLKLQVKYSDLVPAKQKDLPKKMYIKHQFTSTVTNPRLDIRGQKPEEAEYEVIRFLDDAYASNLDKVEIVHGKGTGVLKKTVHDLLKKHDHVKDYYFAGIEFGGEGLTIIELE